jgi:hypothetical protein
MEYYLAIRRTINLVICGKMAVTGGHYVKRKKLGPERQIFHGMWKLK